VLVLGSASPSWLSPLDRQKSDGQFDLIALAPDRAEARQPAFVRDAVAKVRNMLGDDGVAYVLADRRSRRKLLDDLSAGGLVLETAFVHDPDVQTSRHLVPVARAPAMYAFSNLIPTRSWRRRLAALLLALPGGTTLLPRALANVGFVLRRPNARPAFEWLSQFHDGETAAAILTIGRHRPEGAIVLHHFAVDAGRPDIVAKISADTPTPGAEEAEILKRLAPPARAAGAEIPEVLAATRLGPNSLLLESPLGGRSAAAILADEPQRLAELHRRLAAWIERWNRSTAATAPLTHDRLVALLVTPARRLAPHLAEGEEYAEWLEARCAEAVGTSVPLVAAHNDLTMSNVFVDNSNELGVVDWEAASEDSLPLTDFYYAVADAAAATDRYRDRARAFRACFSPGGSAYERVSQLERGLRSALELSAPVSELCFHACWLHHAVNEHRRRNASPAQPFLSLVRSAAIARD
jgi:Ser/Thr protein kinase RdoA (MazF antagonist)